MSNVIIQKRGKYYQYKFEIAKVDGKRKFLSKSGFKTKAEAEKEGIIVYNDYINELEERVSIQKTNNTKLTNENQQLKEKVIIKEFETGEKLRQMQMQVDKYKKYIKKIQKDIIDEIERKDLER